MISKKRGFWEKVEVFLARFSLSTLRGIFLLLFILFVLGLVGVGLHFSQSNFITKWFSLGQNSLTGAELGIDVIVENVTLINDSNNNLSGNSTPDLTDTSFTLTPTTSSSESSLITENLGTSAELGVQDIASGTACGDVAADLTLTADVLSTSTCFNISANSITLNCDGFTVKYATTTFGYGVNNTLGYDNVNIKNCVFVAGTTDGGNNHAIYFNNSFGGNITNNSIYTNGTSGLAVNYGIYLDGKTNLTKINNNTITTGIDNGSISNFNYGIYILGPSFQDNITNNIISTHGNLNNYGVYLSNSVNNSLIYNNQITTTGTNAQNYGIVISTNSGYNNLSANTINTNGTDYNYGIALDENTNYNVLDNNTIKAGGRTSSNIGIFTNGPLTNNNITNNIIFTNGTLTNYGIELIDNTNNSLLYNNQITTTGTSRSNYGIFLLTKGGYNNISNNIINTNGTADNYGILFHTNDVAFASDDYNLLFNNSIITNGTGANNFGIYFHRIENSNNVTNNVILTNGASGNHGVVLNQSSNNTFIAYNNITAGGTGSPNYGIYFNRSVNTTLFNNNLSSRSNDYVIFDSSSGTTLNSLIYNNSFGQINWTSTNLTTNITLQIGNTIFVQSNLIGLTDNPQALNLDGPAQIEIRNRYYNSTPMLLKDGVGCDTTNACNVSYDAVNGILYANISSFSNYSSLGGGDNLTSSVTFSRNITTNATGLYIGANDVVLDCNGYTINYSAYARGYGIDNQRGYDNVTIKNCNLLEGNMTINKNAYYFGIVFNNAQNGTIFNNSFTTRGSFSYSIYLNLSSNGTNVSYNTITALGNTAETYGSTSYGVYMVNSARTNISYNQINTSGNNAHGIYGTPASTTRVFSNNINASGNNARGIFFSSSNNLDLFSNAVNSSGSTVFDISCSGGNDDNATLYNNTINGDIGLHLGCDGSNVSSNYIGPDGDYRIHFGGDQNIFYNNTIIGYDYNAVDFQTDCDYNNFSYNYLYTSVDPAGNNEDAWGINIEGSSDNNIIDHNLVNTTGTTSHSFYIAAGSNNLIRDNDISANTSDASGIYLITSSPSGNIFLNNNITGNNYYTIFDGTGSTVNNTLIYNNSFGQINWTLSALTTNVTLKVGETIFLENNKVGLTDSSQRLNLSYPAQIELKQATYTTPQLLKDGVRCDNSNACNMSYDSTAKIIYANISTFSNYSAQETPTAAAAASTTASGESGGSATPSAPPATATSTVSEEATVAEAQQNLEVTVAVLGEATAAPGTTVSETVASEAGEAAVADQAIEIQPVNTVQNVLVSMVNTGGSSIVVTPHIEAVSSSKLRNRTKELVELELLAQAQRQGVELTPEELSRLIDEEVIYLSLLEEEEIKSLVGLLEGFVDWKELSGLSVSGNRITGRLLQPRLKETEEIIIPPGETVQKVLAIENGISREEKPIKIVFLSNGQKVAEKEVPRQIVKGSAIDLNDKKNTLDLYLVIPKSTDSAVSSNPLKYYLELDIDLNGSTLYSDIFGPVIVLSNESYILSQQFNYNPKNYFGKQTILARLLEGDTLVAVHQFQVDFTEGVVESTVVKNNRLEVPVLKYFVATGKAYWERIKNDTSPKEMIIAGIVVLVIAIIGSVLYLFKPTLKLPFQSNKKGELELRNIQDFASEKKRRNHSLTEEFEAVQHLLTAEKNKPDLFFRKKVIVDKANDAVLPEKQDKTHRHIVLELKVNEKLKNHLERINTELARYGIIQRDNPGFLISNLKKKKESPYSRVDIRKNKAPLDLKLEELQEQIRNLDSISKVRTTLITSKPGKKLRDTTFSYPLGKGWPIASSDLRLKKQVHQAERQLRDIESFRGKRRELRFRKRI